MLWMVILRATVISILLLTLHGCISIDARLQPTDESVKPEKKGSDCAPIFFGLGGGVISVDNAMAKQVRVPDAKDPEITRIVRTPYITKIRSIELQDTSFLIFGSRCIEVTGE